MTIFDITVQNMEKQSISLESFKGKVLLIVNTATGCGFTPQYAGLQKLYENYKDKGFEVLDFPCNQFLNQAPGTENEINSFCTLRYNTTFPRFAKIKVNGKEESPLYAYLKSQKEGRIKWNFTKFLIDREGKIVGRYAPNVKPEEIEADIRGVV